MQALSQLSYGPETKLPVTGNQTLLQGGKMYVSLPVLSSCGAPANVVQGPVQPLQRARPSEQAQGRIDGG